MRSIQFLLVIFSRQGIAQLDLVLQAKLYNQLLKAIELGAFAAIAIMEFYSLAFDLGECMKNHCQTFASIEISSGK